ncbi:hypothetical protein HanXRQr2_Chr10g0450491 [Helianthus annuus]|uniref:Uncharacterized protein n=1 Tax=Helianthus annuus TaxID=4232 RepID=A0A251TN58_HELAN|nr:hypothetical protein HanXRQr2_Chr10g0450491 [Helianthus annuus]
MRRMRRNPKRKSECLNVTRDLAQFPFVVLFFYLRLQQTTNEKNEKKSKRKSELKLQAVDWCKKLVGFVGGQRLTVW